MNQQTRTLDNYLEASWVYWLSSPRAPRLSFADYKEHLGFAYGTLGLRPSMVFHYFSRPLFEQDSEQIVLHLKAYGYL